MRRTMTLERPAPRGAMGRGPVATRTREAHLMSSVVEGYGRPREEGAPASPAPPPPSRRRGELPVTVETLQTLLRRLVMDPEAARQMQVNPARTMSKMNFLTERDRKRLSDVNPEVLESLADAASRYARAAKEARYGGVGIPLGPRGGPMDRAQGALDRFGRGGSGGGGVPADIAPFLPGSGPNPGDFGVPGIPGGGSRGGGGGGQQGGRRGTGGLSRG